MIGQLVGNYRVLRLIGQGGMGQVFEAVHEQIKRRAAIKVLNPEFSRDSAVIRRFFNEALAVNVIQHPSIVGVFESGQLPGGEAFIVMEFLDGKTLSSQLNKESVLAEKDALFIARQIGSALAAAHAKDIVHRDLKPDNVMLVPDPEVPGGRRVKILDFGLAKIATKYQPATVETKDGTIMGTPSYMPPEQWMSATMVDAKSDVYALGVMLFEMLTGRCPFLGENINQLMTGHMYEDPPSVKQFEPGVSAGTVQLVALMLNKTRGSRPTMAEVSENIERLLNNHTTPTPAAVRPIRKAPDPVNASTMVQVSPALEKTDLAPPQWTNLHIDKGKAEAPSAEPPKPAEPSLSADATKVVPKIPAPDLAADATKLTPLLPARPTAPLPARTQPKQAAAPAASMLYLVLGAAVLLAALISVLLLR